MHQALARGSGIAVLVGLLGVGGGPAPPRSPQSREGGSDVPCALPLRWRVARVDGGFGLGVDSATAIVRAAAAMWEAAAGETLFVQDTVDGFPIRLVFDERQERTLEQRRRRDDLEGRARALDAERAALTARSESWGRARAAYESRVAGHDRRLAEHNAEVREWNARGGAPEEIGARLEEERHAIEADGRVLRREAAGLDEALTALRRDEEGFNRAVADHRRRADDLARAFPPVFVQSGEYREAVERSQDGALVSVAREIRIYRFGDGDEMRLVAAHELGHALGLDHGTLPDAVMSDRYTSEAPAVGAASVHPEDARALRAACGAVGRTLSGAGGARGRPRSGAHPPKSAAARTKTFAARLP